MGFASGSVSFKRFAVVGNKLPARPDEKLLEKLDELALRPGEIGVPEEIEYGWSGGRHVFDATFSFEHNVYNDALHFALRVDTNKVPGELKKAWQAMEEDAAAKGNPSGFISKNQKKDVKDAIRKKAEDELRTGRFRRSKLVPLLWDFPTQTVYAAVGGKRQEMLLELFERTFGWSLEPVSAGSLGLSLLEKRQRRREYEDARPTRFAIGPEGENVMPEYPWVAKGPEPKDFLGNEFLLWLIHEADARTGNVVTDAAGEVTVMIDRSLDLDCAYGLTGKDTLRGDGPSRMPEAKDAFRSGKLPRKAGVLMIANGQQYEFAWNPETFAFASTKLPEVEGAENPRVLFEERVAMLRDFCKAADGLFDAFLKVRSTGGWEGHTNTLRRWIASPMKQPVAAVA
ncbi:MAG TPA: hypothetical protein VK324_09035 [Tepidisphaeraceae bacterium]|nr:hypothetical protein [Tepidisphaeraceae bacterium]